MALRELRMRILNYPLFLSEKRILEKGKNKSSQISRNSDKIHDCEYHSFKNAKN